MGCLSHESCSNLLSGPQTSLPYTAIGKITLSNIFVQILTGMLMLNSLVFNAYIMHDFSLSACIAILKFSDVDMLKPR